MVPVALTFLFQLESLRAEHTGGPLADISYHVRAFIETSFLSKASVDIRCIDWPISHAANAYSHFLFSFTLISFYKSINRNWASGYGKQADSKRKSLPSLPPCGIAGDSLARDSYAMTYYRLYLCRLMLAARQDWLENREVSINKWDCMETFDFTLSNIHTSRSFELQWCCTSLF